MMPDDKVMPMATLTTETLTRPPANTEDIAWSRFPELTHTRINGCDVFYSMDDTPHGLLRHLSASRKSKLPTWMQLLRLKELFFGDIDCFMVMPKRADYVNIEKHCFHVWESPETWGIQ